VVYAGEGHSLVTFALDPDTGALARQGSIDVEEAVQFGAITNDARHLYVSLSDNAKRHFVQAFQIAPTTGMLARHGDRVSMPNGRAIHLTLDGTTTHLVMAHNATGLLDAMELWPDGGLGSIVLTADAIDAGNFVHQVRVHPSNRFVFACARGTDATPTAPEQLGQIGIWKYDAGRLTALSKVELEPGVGARHLDFRGEHDVYVAAERGNLLLTYGFDGNRLVPRFRSSTLSDPTMPNQRVGAIRVHPNGAWVYVSNRNNTTQDRSIQGASRAVFAGGVNEIVLFRIDARTGEPKRVAGFETHGFEPRTFTIDPTRRWAIVANQKAMSFEQQGSLVTARPNLSVFHIESDGALTFRGTYQLGGDTLWVDAAEIAVRAPSRPE